MFDRLRAIFSGTSTQIIKSGPQGDSQQITPSQVLHSLVNLPSGSSLATLLIDASTDVGAMRYSPILASERFITESIAALPLITYERTGTSKERATYNPIYNLLRARPNDYQNAYTFHRVWIQNAIRFGNGYAIIERNGAGVPANLVLLDNSYVKVKFDGGIRYYEYTSPQVQGVISNEDMLHLIGYTQDGISGCPLLHYADSVIKLGLAVERYALRFFSQGTINRGHIEIPPGVDQAQYDQITNSFREAYSGADNNWKTPTLPYGSKWINDSVPNDDAQLLDLRKFQLLEAARVMRVPPHVIQHFETGGTYANIEAQSIDLVQNSLQPWITQIEQEVNAKLFGNSDLYAEYLIDARLRGDTLSRYQAYQIGRQGGWLSVNDIRRTENMSEIDGGDDYLATPVGAAPNPPVDSTATATSQPAADQTGGNNGNQG